MSDVEASLLEAAASALSEPGSPVESLDDIFAQIIAQRRGEMLFEAELAKPDDEVDFVKAACYIAMHRDPAVTHERVEEVGPGGFYTIHESSEAY